MLSLMAPVHARLDSVLAPEKLTGTLRGQFYERLTCLFALCSLGMSILLVVGSYGLYGLEPSRFSIGGVALFLLGIVACLAWHRIIEVTNQASKLINRVSGGIMIMYIGIGFIIIPAPLVPFLPHF